MNDEMNKMMKRIEDFLNDMEKEALSLGIYEKLEDVFILLGYQHPKQFKSIGEGIRSGWKPVTLDMSDIIEAKGCIFAVMEATAKLRLDLVLRRTNGEGEVIDKLKESGEISRILLQGLTNKYVGKWYKEDQIPKGWAGLKKYSYVFSRKAGWFLSKSEEVFSVPCPFESLVQSVLNS